jgi:hypothetical protein
MDRTIKTVLIASVMATGFIVMNDSKIQKKMSRKTHRIRKKLMKKL